MKTQIRFTFILTAVFAAFFSTSCKKNSTGGKAEVHAMIYHGTTPIVGTTTLFVKFDATAQPNTPTENYDLKVLGEVDDNHVHIEELRQGNYYLYALAYDSLTKTPVKGGAAVTIKWSERKEMKDVMIMVE